MTNIQLLAKIEQDENLLRLIARKKSKSHPELADRLNERMQEIEARIKINKSEVSQ